MSLLLLKVYMATNSIMYGKLNFSPFQITFYQHHKHLYRDGGEPKTYSKAKQFSRRNSLDYGLFAIKMSQNMAKSIVYINNKSNNINNFQQGGCLYKPISGVHWTLVVTWQASETNSAKADWSTFNGEVLVIRLVGLLMELMIGDENHSLSLCVYVAGFGKSVFKKLNLNVSYLLVM